MKGKLTGCLCPTRSSASRSKRGRISLRANLTKGVATALGAVLGAGVMAPASSAERLGVQLERPDNRVEVFVQLETPSVSELNIESKRLTGRLASREAQRARHAAIEAEQARFRQQLASLGAEELSALQVGANGLRIRVDASQVARLRNMPGVRSVGRVELHYPDNAVSVPGTGATQVWEQLGIRGDGVTIGIIDTGIDYTHANFGGPGTPEAYTGNNKNIVEPGTFPTAKVVGGWDFAGPTYNASNPASVPQPDPDPLDGNGHGSHVAGSAAGIGVPGIIGPGVAPNAKLYALKVFGDVAGSTNLTSDAIEWALDPNGDGDMSDHLDVINMSLGSPFGEPTDPSSIAAQNAAELGIIVVTSAGNENDVPYVTGAPGVAPAAISTAAISPAGGNPRLNVTAPASVAGLKYGIEGTSPVRIADVQPVTGTLVVAEPLDGCAALTNAAAVSGRLVLIQRGTCNFSVKVANAQTAGAIGVVMFNNAAALPIVMGGLETSAIPSMMISLADGTALAAAATTDASSPVVATMEIGPNPVHDHLIADFSSRGPGHGGSTFKPDLSAPGVSIVSTGVGLGTGARTLQGTSMAAPHVAGAAALLRQKHPNLPQWNIKALLQNSTEDVSAAGDTSLARTGVGALRVDKAIALTSYAFPGGVSFGRLNPTKTVNLTQLVTLQNLGNGTRTFQVTHRPQKTYPGVTVQCPQSVRVGSQLARDFTIRLKFDPTVAAEAGVFDDGFQSQTEVDGWCILSDGKDTLRVGYLAVVDAASRMNVSVTGGGRVHRIRNPGPGIGIAEAFTWINDFGRLDASDPPAHSIARFGARTGDPAFWGSFAVGEFGIALGEKFEHISNLDFELYIDADRNGTEDMVLIGADLSRFVDTDPGTFVTAQFRLPSGQGFLDWIVPGWDFNDQVAILPFTKVASGGLLPDSFDYRLVVISRDGSRDEQRGSFDFANELKPDLNSFLLDTGGQANVRVSGAAGGQLLWLFPNNAEQDQAYALAIDPTN